MPVINVLPSEIFNRIAAGEVIENPASIVKELLENSIDAGANTISVEIKNGGRYIKISDNGSGISKDDLPTAFLPHATSKIRNIMDLDAISTLGFRGEALPSIASVAKISVATRQKDSELGAKIIIENGKTIDCAETGCALGTTIVVEDLFKNVPARLKFLKSDRTEEGAISELVGKFILANYSIAISLSINDKIIYQSSGNGLKEAIFVVYGGEFVKETSYIESIMSDIEVFGCVSKPGLTKHNRSYQTLIVNGRYVINSDISFWVYNCFSNLLMKRQYPAYVLYLNLPHDMVDINVHPNKMDVKFVNFDRIRRLLSTMINETLSVGATFPREVEVTPSKPILSFEPTTISGMVRATTGGNYLPKDIFAMNEPGSNGAVKPLSSVKMDNEVVYHESFYDSICDFKIIGTIFRTYIILELGDETLIIDQHAAHEKILYDRLKCAIENGTNSTQNMLIPYVFELSASEAALMEKAAVELERAGFTISRLSGNSFSLSGMPLVLSEIKMDEFISQLVSALLAGKVNNLEFIKETIMQTACKSAVKGNTPLSDNDIKYLIKDIANDKIKLQCPHGRPICVKIKKSEIEKWFKRIV